MKISHNFNHKHWNKNDLLVILLLILCVSLFHIRGILPGQTFLPTDLVQHILPWRSDNPSPLQNPELSDPLYEFYTFSHFTIDHIKSNCSLPLWNPYIFLGHPIFADVLFQTFYPFFTVLELLFNVAHGLSIGLWLHIVISSLLMYAFLRTINCNQSGALLGSFTYALSGYMVTFFEIPFWIATLTWFPGILWTFELSIRHKNFSYAVLSSLMMGLAILGGQFSFVITFTSFLFLYSIGRIIEIKRNKGKFELFPAIVFLIIILLGALISSIQTIPIADLLSLSHRTIPKKGLGDYLPIKQLITLILPDFYGNPVTIRSYWGPFNFSEVTIYAGLPALILALTAPIFIKRFFPVYIFFLGLLFAYFITGGPGTDLFGYIPLIKYTSQHRSVFILPLIIGILSAMVTTEKKSPFIPSIIIGFLLILFVGIAFTSNVNGVQTHWEKIMPTIPKAVALSMLTILLLILKHQTPQKAHILNWGLATLVFFDLFLFGWRYNPVGPYKNMVPTTPAIQYLKKNVGFHRVVAAYVEGKIVFGPNMLSLFKIAEGGGYSSFVPKRLKKLIEAGDPMNRHFNLLIFKHPTRKLLDLLQVKYIASPVPLSRANMHPSILPDLKEVYQGEIYLFEIQNPIPRSYVVYASETITEEEQVINRLFEDSFDFRKTAIIAEKTDLPSTSHLQANPAEIIKYKDTQILIKVFAKEKGLLVLGDLYYPGWEAKVDGTLTPILRVNHILRGVILQPGEHTILFEFKPKSLKTGTILTLTGIALSIILIILNKFIISKARQD